MGRSEPETQVSKRVWRNIGGANTAIKGKRGGGDYHRISKVRLWSPKVRKLCKKKTLGRSKVCLAKSVFCFYKRKFLNLEFAL